MVRREPWEGGWYHALMYSVTMSLFFWSSPAYKAQAVKHHVLEQLVIYASKKLYLPLRVNGCEMSYMLSLKVSGIHKMYLKMLKRDIQQPSCDQFQNRVSADQCHMTVLQAQVYSVQLIEVTCFFIAFCLPVMVFK